MTYFLKHKKEQQQHKSVKSRFVQQKHIPTMGGGGKHCEYNLAGTKYNHILSDGKQRPAEDQQDIQQAQNTITYRLMASKDHQSISRIFSRHKTQSHTSWWQAKTTRGSAGYSAGTKHIHIQADGKQRPAEDQQDIQQAQNTITYPLMASKDQQRISRIFSRHKTQSHTL